MLERVSSLLIFIESSGSINGNLFIEKILKQFIIFIRIHKLASIESITIDENLSEENSSNSRVNNQDVFAHVLISFLRPLTIIPPLPN